MFWATACVAGTAAAGCVAATAVPALPVAAVQSLGSTLDWNTLLSQLNLQGMALQLAKNSVLAGFADGRVVLNLAPQHKHLQSKIAQDKLQAALSDYFAKPIRLAVELGATADVATPAAVEQHEKQTRQQQAEEAIRNDAFVREAQAQLGAQLIEGSIRPV